MAARWVGVGILIVFLAIVGVLVAGGIMGPRERPSVASRSDGVTPRPTSARPVIIREQLGLWRLDGEIALAETGEYQLTLRFTDQTGQPAAITPPPLIQTAMVDHDMGIVVSRAEPTSPGLFRAAGMLAMEGRWRLGIVVGDARAEIAVDFSR
ncbi:hypothetical protein FK498_00605 [Elioraea sp. Yellowstone]|jgi:hypothetical protein|uniref:hypothetical protein n=1 Tax=Elioraea sp. Yellowstone TaxID=2592070 RepID=UPI0011545F77|nr:hypothetical protein [Elioraea sp. Yellowstone]TQF85223.1 hypothetical protein FK498_00605 [Elioraea sp. Yellowstone]